MSRSRGRRYDNEPKLNIKKVIATIIAIVVFIMFVLSLKNLLTKEEKPKEVVNVETYFSSMQDGKWGVINNKGDNVIPLDYNEMVIIPSKTKDIFICQTDTNYENGTYKTKVLNKDGKEILTNYNQVEAIQNSENSQIWYEDDVLTYLENEKYGLIDFSGKKLTEAIYDKIYALPGIEKSIIVEKDGKVGLVSIGQVILEPEYAEIKSLNKSNSSAGYIVKNSDNKYGVIDGTKKQILDFKYDEIKQVSGNNLYVVKENGTLKVIDKDDNTKLENKFDDVLAINGENIIIAPNTAITDIPKATLVGDVLGTGAKVKVEDKEYTLVVLGDVNGDGKITPADYVRIKNDIMETTPLEGVYKIGADVNRDGKITPADYVRVKNHIMDTAKISL